MNFWQRAVAALVPLVWKVYKENWAFPHLEDMMKNGLGLVEVPKFVDIEANTSLVFINSHWSTEYPRSYPPNVIPVGGIAGHSKGKPLPKNLEDFINKGKDGFIYVSFGTVGEFTKFDPEVRQAFVNTLHKFPNIQFIWKSTYPIQEKLPKNVLVEKWLPQKDILVHPKIRMYITHGGVGGIYESILSKVPMICFPIFAEQEFNANTMVEKGYGIKLELISLKEEEVTDAVAKILSDSSYKKNVEKVSKMFTDRPISPLDTAVWWIEFLLRNPDSPEFLRPLSSTQSWWVRRQLDVWAFIFIVAILFISIPLLTLYFVVRLVLKKVLKLI
ncbi:UDP-glucuronosyltransferase 1-9 [Orchesella cincta]|uniref:UDP-glucuronosyltransferase 1-9 n=1 Tax=Orchesella cincta TaxID=48709 RepID=A0A1D2M3L8_ORCCI|nr:UDP-glucuronosyltransferase 1-9 [Orchesella cincta]